MSKRIALLLLMFTLPSISIAASHEERALVELKKFQWTRFEGDLPPCPSLDCHLTWAAQAMALGDVGAYARRVKVPGMQRYAISKGIHQDFKTVAKLESLTPAAPGHFNLPSTIKAQNQPADDRDGAYDLSVDSRVRVGILVNDIPVEVFLDSGATFTLPAGSPSAKTLELSGVQTSNTSGLGKTEVSAFSTAKEISIGDMRIENLMAKTNATLAKGDINSPGLIGYDLLLRFDAVTVDLQSRLVKFNSVPSYVGNCVPLELVVDNDRIPAGLAVDLLIDDVPFKARIDTGANVDVVLHGKNVMPWKMARPSRIMAVDSGGNAAVLEEMEGNVSLDTRSPSHRILRSPYPHNDFKATLGVKFFLGRSFTFDFKHARFCLD